MSDIRVLHVIPSLAVGGAERLVSSLLGHPQPGVELGLCTFYDAEGTHLEEAVRRLGVRWWTLGKRPGIDLRLALGIVRVIKDFRPDLVHTHLSVIPYTLGPQVLSGIRGVHTIHSQPEREVGRLRRVIHQCAFRTGWITPVAISSCLAESIQSLYGLKNRPPVVVNGVNTKQFGPGEGENPLRQALKLGDEAPIIIHVGNFSRQKNHELLLRAMAIMTSTGSQVHLALVGDGELRGVAGALAKSLGLEFRVHFLGARPDVERLLKGADALVLSSDWEGLPIVILEAMASEVPIVATRVGGIPDVVIDEKTGFLVPPNDAPKLADALLRLLNCSPSERRRMGKRARRKVQECFDIRCTAARYAELYRQLVRDQ